MKKLFLPLLVFGVSFGYIESALVVYLRRLYYPAGFDFPLMAVEPSIAAVEIIREITTLLLLWATATLTAKTRLTKIAVFGFLFGVWDLAYYLFLKLILNWPATWHTWDVLFLLPLPWAGPVWAPMVVAVGLIYGGAVILIRDQRSIPLVLTAGFWWQEILAGVIIIVTFIIPGRAIITGTSPQHFPWYLFWVAFIYGAGLFIKRQIQPPAATDKVRGNQ